MVSNPLQVFEHDTLRVGNKGLTEKHFNALVRFNQRNSDRIFTVRHKSLRFGSYVGVIQVGRLTIEILPKTDRLSFSAAPLWRDALIDMLHYCGYLKARISTRAGLDVRRASLLDLYLVEFLHEAEKIFMYGLAKTYRRDQDNLFSLKGRLLLDKQISCNLIHRERFFVEYDRYDNDNSINQILKRALIISSSTATSWVIRDRALSLSHYLEAVSETEIDKGTFDRLRFTRKTERYRHAIALAYLIILNYQPDIRSGKNDVIAILFDMNVLFERYVYKQISNAARNMNIGVTIIGQKRYPFWRQSSGEERGVRPDIEVRANGQSPVVIDTKWKQPGLRPSDGDLKQMYVYSKLLQAKKCFLIYPYSDARVDVDGEFVTDGTEFPSYNFSIAEKMKCSMHFVKLFDSNSRLSSDVGTDIIRSVIPEFIPQTSLDDT